MDISQKLRTKIERTSGNSDVFQVLKSKEEIDKELSVSTMADRDFDEILNSNEFAKFKEGIRKRLPSLYNFISGSIKKCQIRLVLLFNLTTRFPDYLEDYIGFPHTTTAVDLACCILSYDFLLEVREWQEASGTLLGEDRYESMRKFLPLISHCHSQATREEYEEFLTEFSKLFVLIEAKRRALTKKPKKHQRAA